jgi:hypothetical protein
MDVRIDGGATAYRLFDVGYAIDLEAAARLLGGETRGRSRPARLEAQTFQIRNPPLFALLGDRRCRINNTEATAQLSAHLFDFGVCSLRLTVRMGELAWSEYVEFGRGFDASTDVETTLEQELGALVQRIAPAIERPGISPVREEYVVFRVNTPFVMDGDEQLVPLLLHEERKLSANARRELLAHRFSYYQDDLAVITWDNALVVEPRAHDEDVEFVLEFANAQLLELRVYDEELDAELPALYDRIEERRRRTTILSRHFRPLLAEMQTRVADITEVVERADNAFKITDDVYLARIYRAALELFRDQAWRRGIDRKLQIFRDTYSMLNAETQAARAELLEVIVVVLIAVELIVAVLH